MKPVLSLLKFLVNNTNNTIFECSLCMRLLLSMTHTQVTHVCPDLRPLL